MIKTAIAFLFGCLCTLSLPCLPALVWSWLLLPPIAIALYWRNWPLLFFILGALWSAYHVYDTLTDRLVTKQQNQLLLIQGRIASIPEIYKDKIQFLFEPDHSNLPRSVLLNWYSATTPLPKAGEHWQLQVKLKSPHGLSNPGSFDYEKWLFVQGIGATGYVKTGNNHIIKKPVWYDIQHQRQQLSDILNERLASTTSLPLILGLTIGDRSSLTPQQWQVLQKTGTNHLLAISGLHIGLIALTVFFIWRWLWSLSAKAVLLIPAQQCACIAALIVVLGYALLAGMTIPTQRALIMTSTALLGVLFMRRFYLSQLLAVSLVLVLLFDPFAVISIGFWLSFCAVALIVFCGSNRYPQHKWAWARIHLWLCLGLAPLVLLFFHQTSLCAPIANLVAVPVISFVIMPILLAAVITLGICPMLSNPLFALADRGLNWVWQFLQWVSQFPSASWQTPDIPWHLFILACLGVVTVLLPKGFPARWLGLFAMIPIFTFKPAMPVEGQIKIAVLDVGQGLSVIVESHQHVLVFDTGGYFSERFDMGSAVVVPYLQSLGIDKINTLIISHSDIDHAGGTQSLRKAIYIEEILTSDTSAIEGSNACSQGQHWQWDGVDFKLLQPAPEQKSDSDNNRSCVLKISSKNLSVLLTGDIEKESEQWLVNTYGDDLKADILVVPHHGSRSSSSAVFIDKVQPSVASFSVGYLNRYHFPAHDVVQRYQDRHIQILRTDHTGAQLFSTLPDGKLNVGLWRELDHSLWSSRPTE